MKCKIKHYLVRWQGGNYILVNDDGGENVLPYYIDNQHKAREYILNLHSEKFRDGAKVIVSFN